MKCTEIREMLPAYAGEREPSAAVRRHLGRCPDCAAELERYQDVLGALKLLEARPSEAPPGLVSTLAAIPQRAGRADHVRAHVNRNRRAYAGAGAALAGAVVGAVVLGRRRRAPAAA
ncbi:MAG: anti-sigma factor family protein [Actinomycetota bacterium]